MKLEQGTGGFQPATITFENRIEVLVLRAIWWRSQNGDVPGTISAIHQDIVSWGQLNADITFKDVESAYMSLRRAIFGISL